MTKEQLKKRIYKDRNEKHKGGSVQYKPPKIDVFPELKEKTN